MTQNSLLLLILLLLLLFLGGGLITKGLLDKNLKKFTVGTLLFLIWPVQIFYEALILNNYEHIIPNIIAISALIFIVCFFLYLALSAYEKKNRISHSPGKKDLMLESIEH